MIIFWLSFSNLFCSLRLCTVLDSIPTMLHNNYHGKPYLILVLHQRTWQETKWTAQFTPIHLYYFVHQVPAVLPNNFCEQLALALVFHFFTRAKSGHLIQGLTLDPDASLPPSWSYFKEVTAALCPLKVTFPSPLRRLKILIDPSS